MRWRRRHIDVRKSGKSYFDLRYEKVDVAAVDVSGMLSRLRINDIIEAQQRTHQPPKDDPESNRN